MIDATILIPTFRHVALLPHALRSALDQEGTSVEVLVVGDGVEDDTRAALEPYGDDERVRFFDFPKGERHGELNRHEALGEAKGRIVCYLSDDDLLLPGHVTEMGRLLEDAGFAHSPPFAVMLDGSLWYAPVDISSPVFQKRLLGGGWNVIGLTGVAHTLAAYRELPHGWRPAPTDVWTDLYMWQQFVAQPGFRGKTGSRLTHLHFPDEARRDLPVAERVAELELWSARARQQGFEIELARAAAAGIADSATRSEAT